MSARKHTPGPWVADLGLGEVRPANVDPDVVFDRYICEINSLERDGEPLLPAVEESEANAHLIAAAPDMLEALENLENDDGKAMPPSAWALVQNAIAKAKGETPWPTRNP